MPAQIAIYDENGKLDTSLDTSYMRMLGQFILSGNSGEFYDARMVGQNIWFTTTGVISGGTSGVDFPYIYASSSEGKIKWSPRPFLSDGKFPSLTILYGI